MGHTPTGVDRLLIRTATAARAGMATTADISTGVHPTRRQGQAHNRVTLLSPPPTLVDATNRLPHTHSA